MAVLRKRYGQDGSFVYVVDFRYKGRRFQRSTKTNNKKLANRILDEIRGRIASGRFKLDDVQEKNITLKEFAEEYLTTHSLVEKSPGTAAIDKQALDDFMEFAGPGITLRLVTESMARSFRKWLQQKRVRGGKEKMLSPTTVNIKMRALRTAFNWALAGDRRYVDHNPFSGIRQIPVDEPVVKSFHPEELKRIFEFAEKDGERGWLFGRYMLFLLLTGCRRTEAVRLRLGDIDFHNGFISFSKTKTNKDRQYPMTPTVQKVLLEVIDRLDIRQPEQRIFPYEDKYPTFLFTKYKRWLGLRKELHLHCFRHTCAFVMLKKNLNILHIKDLLGHQKLDTTLKYLRSFPTFLKEVASEAEAQKVSGYDPNELIRSADRALEKSLDNSYAP
jgi:integrase